MIDVFLSQNSSLVFFNPNLDEEYKLNQLVLQKNKFCCKDRNSSQCTVGTEEIQNTSGKQSLLKDVKYYCIFFLPCFLMLISM